MNISRSLPHRILIVEDSASSRELLRTVLEQLGHVVMEAAGGEEALRKLQEEIPDLILLDLKIPPPDGYELIKAIRRNAHLSSVPVAALTAQAMLGESDKISSAGFDRYLPKPIRPAEIRNEVQRLLQQSNVRCRK